ncbi:hypothetical protein [Krasilnikoviella flava]|uniref:Uncharacterized protein n=1 Tax=Krasilnikoviella flava TaxID=526729 RepID=A0A1T5I6Z5_9MICO|nr:hypothetical protein [Krasilnikoviella flava]SKC34935.1 hypothetical protein SAMN04324258_0056 [Krasilnikoviella flava]
MRHGTRRTLAAAAVGAAGLGLLGTTAATAAPATTAASWNDYGASWNDPNDAGGISVYEKTVKYSNSESVMAQFIANGEHLTIWDDHDNDRKAIVKLWVGKSGPAVFYAKGDNTETRFNLSYDEGQTVKIQVCTSTSSQAQCSSGTHRGRS